jgi:deoxyribose-phosphate aldolase
MVETGIAGFIEHTLLKADATAADVQRLCAEARQYHFLAVCVNGSWVCYARDLLAGSPVMVNSVAGFPLGAMATESKCFETETAVLHGAHEIDVVLNIGRLKQSDDRYVAGELGEIVTAASGRAVKAIIETCLLTDDEKIRACRLAVESGARFVKTSTGFSFGGATVADVRLMRRTVGPDFGIKASGGIRDARAAIAMIEAGATRLGSSAGVGILNSLGETKLSEPRA